jgi:hypothetical protein
LIEDRIIDHIQGPCPQLKVENDSNCRLHCRTMTTIAVMQPYFLPYAGYFRLFAAADRVALLDCVQFPRRGWVHRNQFTGANGDPVWLTLPLQPAPRDTLISELRFTDDAEQTLAERCRRIPVLSDTAAPLVQSLVRPSGDVVDYIATLLRHCCDALHLPFDTIRTSTLTIDPALRGPDRILAIAEALGATRYVNLQGGKALYDPAMFAARGIDLTIFDNWHGSNRSIAERLLSESADTIAREIREQV